MPAPTLSTLSPTSTFSGGSDGVLTLTGSGFDSSIVAYFGTVALVTAYISATSATATVPAALIAIPVVAQVSVIVDETQSSRLPFVAFPLIPQVGGPSPIDLTTVGQVAQWAEVQTQDDNALMQLCVTGFSMFVLRQTGYGNSDGSLPAASPFVQPVPYNQNYDGNNNRRLFLKNYPVQSVTYLSISGLVIPESASWGQQGWVIDEGGKSISLRSGGGAGSQPMTTNFWVCSGGYVFVKDRFNPMNINVQYTAGFNSTPSDLVEMAVRVCATNYKRHSFIDLASSSINTGGGSGTTRYRDWGISPLDERTLLSYKRQSY